MSLRVLVVDDSALARSAIVSILAADPDFLVVGEACDGYEALRMARTLAPDLVLLDLNMPRCDGLLATRLIKRQQPGIIVVILTVSDDAADLFEAIRSGAQGYLLKSLGPTDWVAYLRSFIAGNRSVPRAMANRIIAEIAGVAPVEEASRQSQTESVLTDREAEVLQLVTRAMTNREIAETLLISEQTVKNHLKRIMQKLKVKNRVELAVRAGRSRPDASSLK